MITWKKVAAMVAFSVSTTPLGAAYAADASEMLDEEANAPLDSGAEAEAVDESSAALIPPPVCEGICQRRYVECVNHNLYGGPPNPAWDAAVRRMCRRRQMQCLHSCQFYPR